MKHLSIGVLLIALSVFLTAWTHGSSKTYYISTTGSDGANGLTPATAWASPNHTVGAGDRIIVKAGSYSVSWVTGTVIGTTQPAFLVCETYFACTLTQSGGFASITVQTSYWKVAGFVLTNPSGGWCIEVTPASGTIHHITLIDNVCSFAQNNGIGAFGKVDYLTIQSNIVYNAGHGGVGVCDANIHVAALGNSDTVPGIHTLIKGNLSYSSINDFHVGTTYCAGTNATTDGEGINLDTLGTGGNNYTGLVVVESNIVMNNGGNGIICFICDKNQTIFRNNTSWSNLIDPNFTSSLNKGGMLAENTSNLQGYNNIAMETQATCCNAGQSVYAIVEVNNPATPTIVDTWDWNVAFGVGGQDTFGYNGFTFGANNQAVDPQFANAAVPGAPNCTGQPNIISCLHNLDGAGFDVIARFTPTNVAVKGSGNITFCAPTDITGATWIGVCDPGAIKWSP